MSYVKEFWGATSTAAPVIALAVVVAMPDLATVFGAADRAYYDVVEQTPNDPKDDKAWTAWFPKFRSAWNVWMWVRAAQIVSSANLLLQAALLALSLWALAAGKNVIPPWLAILMAIVGILALAWTVTVTGRARRWGRNANEVTDGRVRRRAIKRGLVGPSSLRRRPGRG